MIDCLVLEYLVPSTGKLYHHKMKLRSLRTDSRTEDMVDYLKKRHPLYFITHKISPVQIAKLIDKIKYRLKQAEEKKGKQEPKKEAGGKNDENDKKKDNATTKDKVSDQYNFPSLGAPSFKSGSQLPSITDITNTAPKVAPKSAAFAQFDYGDDFEDDFEEEDQEEEEEGGDFDANELLNLTDYQNKRKQ